MEYFIFDHVLDLSFHSDEEEDAKVQDENGVIDTNTSVGMTLVGCYGTSKNGNQVHMNPMAVALVAECQNLNSGNLSSASGRKM
jgi:hypothetical protein